MLPLIPERKRLMFNNLLSISTLLAALGSGLIAGVFFAFSVFVMKALAALPPSQGMTAMQSINIAVINPWFIGVFLGTAVVCVLLAASSLLAWQQSGAGWLLAGSVLYLAGTVMVTIVSNVPRNNALAAIDPANPNVETVWTEYVKRWTAWNHVRTIAALAAAASFTMALCRSTPSPSQAGGWGETVPETTVTKYPGRVVSFTAYHSARAGISPTWTSSTGKVRLGAVRAWVA
ncbi:MAG: anthrone oxygenase family protein [Chthoniobacteraceae bacterium]